MWRRLTFIALLVTVATAAGEQHFNVTPGKSAAFATYLREEAKGDYRFMYKNQIITMDKQKAIYAARRARIVQKHSVGIFTEIGKILRHLKTNRKYVNISAASVWVRAFKGEQNQLIAYFARKESRTTAAEKQDPTINRNRDKRPGSLRRKLALFKDTEQGFVPKTATNTPGQMIVGQARSRVYEVTGDGTSVGLLIVSDRTAKKRRTEGKVSQTIITDNDHQNFNQDGHSADHEGRLYQRHFLKFQLPKNQRLDLRNFDNSLMRRKQISDMVKKMIQNAADKRRNHYANRVNITWKGNKIYLVT